MTKTGGLKVLLGYRISISLESKDLLLNKSWENCSQEARNEVFFYFFIQFKK